MRAGSPTHICLHSGHNSRPKPRRTPAPQCSGECLGHSLCTQQIQRGPQGACGCVDGASCVPALCSVTPVAPSSQEASRPLPLHWGCSPGSGALLKASAGLSPGGHCSPPGWHRGPRLPASPVPPSQLLEKAAVTQGSEKHHGLHGSPANEAPGTATGRTGGSQHTHLPSRSSWRRPTSTAAKPRCPCRLAGRVGYRKHCAVPTVRMLVPVAQLAGDARALK